MNSLKEVWVKNMSKIRSFFSKHVNNLNCNDWKNVFCFCCFGYVEALITKCRSISIFYWLKFLSLQILIFCNWTWKRFLTLKSCRNKQLKFLKDLKIKTNFETFGFFLGTKSQVFLSNLKRQYLFLSFCIRSSKYNI